MSGKEMSELVHECGPKNRVTSNLSLHFTLYFLIKPLSHFTNSSPRVQASRSQTLPERPPPPQLHHFSPLFFHAAVRLDRLGRHPALHACVLYSAAGRALYRCASGWFPHSFQVPKQMSLSQHRYVWIPHLKYLHPYDSITLSALSFITLTLFHLHLFNCFLSLYIIPHAPWPAPRSVLALVGA